jgi:hypothetical protein
MGSANLEAIKEVHGRLRSGPEREQVRSSRQGADNLIFSVLFKADFMESR